MCTDTCVQINLDSKTTIVKATDANITHAVSSLSYNKYSIAELDHEVRLDPLAVFKRTSFEEEVIKLVSKLNTMYGKTWRALTKRTLLKNWDLSIRVGDTAQQRINTALADLEGYYVKKGNIFQEADGK